MESVFALFLKNVVVVGLSIRAPNLYPIYELRVRVVQQWDGIGMRRRG
jgi:hypothetical protein